MRPQQPGHVAAKFQDHERGGAVGQFRPAVGQGSRLPNADARLGQFAPQRHGPPSRALADDQPSGRRLGRRAGDVLGGR